MGLGLKGLKFRIALWVAGTSRIVSSCKKTSNTMIGPYPKLETPASPLEL